MVQTPFHRLWFLDGTSLVQTMTITLQQEAADQASEGGHLPATAGQLETIPGQNPGKDTPAASA